MSILTFAAVIDLTIALENDNLIHSVMAFYFVSGEPYLKSGHGSAINYHDGILHFACYVIILLAMDNRFVIFTDCLVKCCFFFVFFFSYDDHTKCYKVLCQFTIL
jgi:hypothetical protein